MRRYKVIMLVPHETYIAAADDQAANQEANRLVHRGDTRDGSPKAILHSVIVEPDNVVEFGPSPAAA